MRVLPYLSLAAIILSACASTPQVETKPTSEVAEPAAQPAVQPAEPAESERKAVQTRPNILVTPAQNGKGLSELQVVQSNPMARAMMEAINGYLTSKMYDVKSLEGEANLNSVIQIQNDIAENEDDLSYLASLALGADVYIKYTGNVKASGIVVNIDAYESATSRLLGSESVSDDECGGTEKAVLIDCLHRAAGRAMPKLEKKILAYWEKDQEQGVQYKIIMNFKGEFDEEKIEDLHDDIAQVLKGSFNKVNINAMTDKTFDVIVYVDENEYPDSQVVYATIRELLKGKASTKKINLTRKLILMDVE